jgi:hypothetical protein
LSGKIAESLWVPLFGRASRESPAKREVGLHFPFRNDASVPARVSPVKTTTKETALDPPA